MCDSHGVIFKGRTIEMNEYKAEFASDTKKRTLTEALQDADVFVGLSVARCVTKEMIKGMKKSPIILQWQIPFLKSCLKIFVPLVRRHHGHRTIRLSESSEQRSGISFHFPGST